MAHAALSAVVRHLQQISPSAVDPRDDRQLIEAFVARHDQAAFTALVRRHGSLVLNVCRRVLRNEQDAEDAFQATFLILAKKAASLRSGAAVAGFLYTVAYHVSLKIRRETTRRIEREAQVRSRADGSVTSDISWFEVQALLEEEIQRLPEKYRLPFVLCRLQGLSRADAARQLGLKEGTVWSRLAQAKKRLQARLSRRGIALTAVLGALAVAERSVRAGLVTATVQAAKQVATGSLAPVASARVSLLIQAGFQRTASKLKFALLGLALLLTIGAGGVIGRALTAQQPQSPKSETPRVATVPEAKKSSVQPVRTDRYGDPLPSGALARLGTVRWRHGFLVHALAYSPDGNKIAAVGAGRDISLWDAVTGKEIHQFPNKGDQPGSLAFSPDGKMLATEGRVCHLWEVATGKELRQFGRGRVAFSPDGKWLATASLRNDDKSIRLWDVASGEERGQIECGSSQVCALAYCPDGKQIASSDLEGTIHLWDLATHTERHRLTGHQKGVYRLAFSPDGKRLASSGDEQSIRLWDTATGRQIRLLGEKFGEYSSLPVAFSPDGTLLASGHLKGIIRLWDVQSGEEKRHWQAGAMVVRALAFSPDGKTLASGAAWEGIRRWDVTTGREVQPAEEHRGYLDYVRYSRDGNTLISVGRERRIVWWDVAKQTLRREFSWSGTGLAKFDLSPDGNSLAVCTWPDLDLQLWDLRTGKLSRTLAKLSARPWGVAFSPDGHLVAAGGEDKEVHVWDVRDGKLVQHIKGIAGGVMCLRFSPDGKSLAGGTQARALAPGQQSLYLWDVASGKEQVRFDSTDTMFPVLAFSPDGKLLACNSGERENAQVWLLDTTTGKILVRHTGHRESVSSLAFSPDGNLVASGSGDFGTRDNSVHVWEAATGQLIHRYEGHHSCVGGLSFAPHGLTLASGAGDSTILLWDITGRQKDGKLSPAALSPRELDACWSSLGSEDTSKAYDAVWKLIAAPEQAVAHAHKHLSPAPRPDPAKVARLLADFDSADFNVRQSAMDELGKIGESAAPALRRALEDKPALEVRRRIQQLLDQTRDWTPERLRDHRAIQALAHIGSPQAREVLQALAEGTPGVYRTEEAKTILQRRER